MIAYFVDYGIVLIRVTQFWTQKISFLPEMTALTSTISFFFFLVVRIHLFAQLIKYRGLIFT